MPTVKNTLLREGSDNVFIVGDTTNIPISKAGSTAHFEADTVIDNLSSLIKEDRWARDYDGKVFCFVETGFNTGTYVWFNYTTPPNPGPPSQMIHWFKLAYNRCTGSRPAACCEEAAMSDMTLSNQPPDEMTRLTLAAREALTDSMVERLAMLGGNALELLDRLNDPNTSAAVHTMIDRADRAAQSRRARHGVRSRVDAACGAQRAHRQHGGAPVHVRREHDQHGRQRGDGRAGREHPLGASKRRRKETAQAAAPRGGVMQRCRCCRNRKRSAASRSCSPSERSCSGAPRVVKTAPPQHRWHGQAGCASRMKFNQSNPRCFDLIS